MLGNPLGGQLRGAGVSDEIIDVVLRFDDRFSHGWRRATSYIDPGLRNIERQLNRVDSAFGNLTRDTQGLEHAQREMARTSQYTARTMAHTEASFMEFGRRTSAHVDRIQTLARTTANRDVRRLEDLARDIGGFLTRGGSGQRLRLEGAIQGRGSGLDELIANISHVAKGSEVKAFNTARARLAASVRDSSEGRPFIFNKEGRMGRALADAQRAVESNSALEAQIQTLAQAPAGRLRLSQPSLATPRPQLPPALEARRRRELAETQVPFGRLSAQEKGAYTKLPHRYVVIDTETTGITPGQDKIFQLSAQQFEGGRPVARQRGGPMTGLNKFLQVDQPVPSQFTRGGKITQDMLGKRGLTFDQLRPMLDEVIGDRPVVMQNALFDAFQMLEQSHGYKIKTPIYDTLTMGRKMFPGERMALDVLRQPGHRLGERTPGYESQYGQPREVFGGIDRTRRLAHEARSDMLDTADLFEFLRTEHQVQGQPAQPFTVPGLRQPIAYSPEAVTQAQALGVDIREVVGSGEAGRVLPEDVLRTHQQRASAGRSASRFEGAANYKARLDAEAKELATELTEYQRRESFIAQERLTQTYYANAGESLQQFSDQAAIEKDLMRAQGRVSFLEGEVAREVNTSMASRTRRATGQDPKVLLAEAQTVEADMQRNVTAARDVSRQLASRQVVAAHEASEAMLEAMSPEELAEYQRVTSKVLSSFDAETWEANRIAAFMQQNRAMADDPRIQALAQGRPVEELTHAQQVGTAYHTDIERTLRDPQHRPATQEAEAVRRWVQEQNLELISAERPVADPSQRLRGTPDALFSTPEGRVLLADFKSGASVEPYPENYAQLAEYANILRQRGVEAPIDPTVVKLDRGTGRIKTFSGREAMSGRAGEAPIDPASRLGQLGGADAGRERLAQLVQQAIPDAARDLEMLAPRGGVVSPEQAQRIAEQIVSSPEAREMVDMERRRWAGRDVRERFLADEDMVSNLTRAYGGDVLEGGEPTAVYRHAMQRAIARETASAPDRPTPHRDVFDEPGRPAYRGDPQPGHVDEGQTMRDLYGPRAPYQTARADAAYLADTYQLMDSVTSSEGTVWGMRAQGARPRWDMGPGIPLPQQFESRSFLGGEDAITPEENEAAMRRWREQADAVGRYFSGLRREDDAFGEAQSRVRQLDDMAERGPFMASDPEALTQQLTDAQESRTIMRERRYGPNQLLASYRAMSRLSGEGAGGADLRRMDEIAKQIAESRGVLQDPLSWMHGEGSGGPLAYGASEIQPIAGGLTERDRAAAMDMFWREFYKDVPAEGRQAPRGITPDMIQQMHTERGPQWLADLNARYEEGMSRLRTPLEGDLQYMGGVSEAAARPMSPEEVVEALVTRHRLASETGQVDETISALTTELDRIQTGEGGTAQAMQQSALNAEATYRAEATASQARRVELESMLGVHDQNRLFFENIMGRSGLGHVFEEAEENVRRAEEALYDFQTRGERHAFKGAELESDLRLARAQMDEAREVLFPQALYDLNQRSVETGRFGAGQQRAAVGRQLDDAIRNLSVTAQQGTAQYRQALNEIIAAQHGEALTMARAPQLQQTAADAAMVESLLQRRDQSMSSLDRSLGSPEVRETLEAFDNASRKLQQLEADRPHAAPDEVGAVDQSIAEARAERDASFAAMQGGVGGLRIGDVSAGHQQMQQAWGQALGDLRKFQEVSVRHERLTTKLSQLEHEMEAAPEMRRQLESEVARRSAAEAMYAPGGARAGDAVGEAEATSRRVRAQGALSDFERRLTEELPLKERELRQGLIWSEQDVAGARGQFQQSLMVPEDLEGFLTENRHLMRDDTVLAVEEARMRVQEGGSRFETEAGKMLEMRGRRGLIQDWEMPLFTQRFAEMFQTEGLPEASRVGDLRTRQVDLRHMIERFNTMESRIGELGSIGDTTDAQRAELAQLERQRQTLTGDGFTTRRAQDLHDQLDDQIREFQAEDTGRPDQKARRKRGRGMDGRAELWQVYEARLSDMDLGDMERRTKTAALSSQALDAKLAGMDAQFDTTGDPQEWVNLMKERQGLEEVRDARKANMDLNERAAEALRLDAEDEAYRHQARKRRLGWDGRAATRLTQTLTGLVGLTVLLAGVTMGLQMGIQSLVEWYMKLREKNRLAASGIRQTTTSMSLQNFEVNKAIEYSQQLNTELDREMRIRLGMASPSTQRGVAVATEDRKVAAAEFRVAAENVIADDRGGLDEETRGQIDSMVLDWQAKNWTAFREYMQPGGLLSGRIDPEWLGKVESEYMQESDRWRILDDMAANLFAQMAPDMDQGESERLSEAIEDILIKGYEKRIKDIEDAIYGSTKGRIALGLAGGQPIHIPDEAEMVETDQRRSEAIAGEIYKVLMGDAKAHSVKDARQRYDYDEMLGIPEPNRDASVKDLARVVAAWEAIMADKDIGPGDKLEPGQGIGMMLEQLDDPELLQRVLGVTPRAGGGTVQPGETTLVGEEGPEIVKMPAGSEVFSSGTGPALDVAKYDSQFSDIERITSRGYHEMHDSMIKYLTDTERQWLSFWHGMDGMTYEGWTEQQRVADEKGPSLADRIKGFFSELFSFSLPTFEWPELPELPDFSSLVLSIPELAWPSLPSFEWPSIPDFLWPDIPMPDFEDVRVFFIETVPGWFSTETWSGIGSAIASPFQAAYDLVWGDGSAFKKAFTQDIPGFFIDTVPGWFSAETWLGIGSTIASPFQAAYAWIWGEESSFRQIFTEDLPTFFTETVPSWFTAETWTAVSSTLLAPFAIAYEWLWGEESLFRKTFTEDLPVFFMETVPGWFTAETWTVIGETFIAPFSSAFDWLWGEESTFRTILTEDVANFFLDTVPGWFSAETWTGIVDTFKAPFSSAFDWVWGEESTFRKVLTEDVATFFTKTVPGWFSAETWSGIVDTFTSPFKLAFDWIWGEESTFRKILTEDVATFFTSTVPGWFTAETWVQVYQTMISPFKHMVTWFDETWSTVEGKITSPVMKAINWVTGNMSSAVDKVNSIIEGFNDFSFTIPGFGFTASVPPISVWTPFGTVSFAGWSRRYDLWQDQVINFPDLPKVPNPFAGSEINDDYAQVGVPNAYMGGLIKSGGVTMVGERGPELVDFPGGARISPLGANHNSVGGGGDIVYVEVPVYIGTRQIKRELIEVMNGTVRERATRLV